MKLSARSCYEPIQQKQPSMPGEYSLAYRERFDGEGPGSGQANPRLDTRWLVAGIKVLFQGLLRAFYRLFNLRG